MAGISDGQNSLRCQPNVLQTPVEREHLRCDEVELVDLELLLLLGLAVLGDDDGLAHLAGHAGLLGHDRGGSPVKQEVRRVRRPFVVADLKELSFGNFLLNKRIILGFHLTSI